VVRSVSLANSKIWYVAVEFCVHVHVHSYGNKWHDSWDLAVVTSQSAVAVVVLAGVDCTGRCPLSYSDSEGHQSIRYYFTVIILCFVCNINTYSVIVQICFLLSF